ncbi:integrase [Hafnia alvei]|uniref:integrase n=1 Tax=Hafnia alvei TaxID=569 RepID=UPI00061D3BD9|nr:MULTISPECIES: integrase [Enterobacterales]KKF38345.1 integrase [Hafnia alvei]MBW3476183.1 integrase [Hafnia alvei]MBW3478302.1 integrase [Hafnia alvei]MBW3478452.1 integrase [Hafnia alvei]
MGEIFHFVPKTGWDAEANVNEFIRRCRDDLTVFGKNINWDSWNWKGVVNYTKVGAPSRGISPEHLLDDKIQDFAKAYIRYQQGHNPTKNIQEIKAIRCIEPALLKVKGITDITQIDVLVLDEAAMVAREQYGSSGYHAGAHLERLAKFISDKGMVVSPINWKNPIQRYMDRNLTGEKGQALREKKLPKDHQLDYMAEMFANDFLDPRDRFTTSMFALSMCAPGRVSEFQDLSIDCIHEENDRKGVPRLGLRFYAGKGYGADIKWVSTPFVSIAKEAIRRLKDLSIEGLKIAKWLETNPDEFYRHPQCPNVDEDDPLTAVQICQAMGWVVQEGRSAMSVAFNPSKNEILSIRQSKGEVTLRDLNQIVHSNLPAGWPWKNKERGVKYSEALLCLRKDELHGNRGVSPVMLWTPDNATFTYDLGPRKGTDQRSIWERHGYKNPDSSEIKLTSHQLRHLLNTVAQRGDLGQFDIAMWSGRTNIHQNRTYNHISEYEVLDKVKAIPSVVAMMGPLDKVKSHIPVTLKDLDAIGEGIAHVTEYGFCVHDFSMIPCQKHLDCINCTEQVCVKGDREKLNRLIIQRDKTITQLAKASTGMAKGFYGAGRWFEHQKRTLERTVELIRLLESDDIEDGSVIRLRNKKEFSSLKRELDAQIAQQKLESEVQIKNEMRALLGGDFG